MWPRPDRVMQSTTFRRTFLSFFSSSWNNVLSSHLFFPVKASGKDIDQLYILPDYTKVKEVAIIGLLWVFLADDLIYADLLRSLTCIGII